MLATNSVERFSNRVDDYAKYRPSYPADILRLLVSQAGLRPGATVADVGSGTGIFTRLLLDFGATVYAVEPNEKMRATAETDLNGYSTFHSRNGTAENTLLADHSVDLITAAQAFHWFDPSRAKQEFQRILRPGGTVALIWNAREDATPFLRAYDDLLKMYATDYAHVNHRGLAEETLAAFFGTGGYQLEAFDNQQIFDFDGVKGRMLSSSYVPKEDHPNHQPLMTGVREIFDRYNTAGTVAFIYRTKVYYGKV